MTERMPPREVLGIFTLIIGIVGLIAAALLLGGQALFEASHINSPTWKAHVQVLKTRILLHTFLALSFTGLAGYLIKRLVWPKTKP